MSLNFGPTQLAIPGPSVMPERVLRAMHRPSPNIYEGELIELTDTLFPDLRTVAQTTGDVAIYIANGHGAWEAAVKNTLVAGDRVVVLGTGRFGVGWGELAQSHGIDVHLLDFGMHSDADVDQLHNVLAADKAGEIRAVLTVQADTATSVLNDIQAIRRCMDNADHSALLMVDCIASLGCDEFRMDDWGVDVMVAGCQKGLMTPAGISFVYFNERAKEARKRAEPGFYWNWVDRTEGPIFYQKFGGTAPTHHLYGLREALNILVKEEGMENAWARHRTLANAIWSALDAWGNGGALHHNIEEHAKRTTAVSTVTTGPEDAARLRQWTETEAGLTLGIGLGFGEPGSPDWRRRFRIGHMGHQNVPMTMGVLGTIDAGLKALGIAHGDGALEAASRVIATHKP